MESNSTSEFNNVCNVKISLRLIYHMTRSCSVPFGLCLLRVGMFRLKALSPPSLSRLFGSGTAIKRLWCSKLTHAVCLLPSAGLERAHADHRVACSGGVHRELVWKGEVSTALCATRVQSCWLCCSRPLFLWLPDSHVHICHVLSQPVQPASWI